MSRINFEFIVSVRLSLTAYPVISHQHRYFLSIFTIDFVKQFQISIYYLNSIQIHTFFNQSQLRFKSRAWQFTLPLFRLSPSTIPLFNSAFIIAVDRSCSCHFFCCDINSNKNISIRPSSKLHMLLLRMFLDANAAYTYSTCQLFPFEA